MATRSTPRQRGADANQQLTEHVLKLAHPTRHVHEVDLVGLEGRGQREALVVWANVVVTTIPDQAGVLQGFAKVTRDLSERRLLEAQQRRLGLLAERERIAKGLFDEVVQASFAVGLGLQAATFADNAALRAKVDAAVRDLDEVIVDLRRHVFQLRSE